MRVHLIYISIIAIALILLLVFFKSGCNSSVKNSNEYRDLVIKNAEYGILISKKNDTINAISKKYTDDASRANQIIVSLTEEKQKLSDVTKRLGSSVTNLSGLYAKARAEADTAMALLLADNQSNICDSYVWQSQRELYIADSLITEQKKDITMKDDYIKQQVKFRDEFMSLALAKEAGYEKRLQIISKENKRLNNWWNKWGSKVAIGVGSAVIGYSAGQISK
jgi:hypothetical protein